MSTARSVRLLLFAAALLSFVGSCVESKYPLSDEKTSKIDERLIGTWRGDVGPEGWQVEKSARAQNALDVTMPGTDATQKMLAFTTTIKSKRYMSVKGMDEAAKNASGGAGFSVLQYAFLDKDTVQVRGMEPNVIENAIANKTLEGEVKIERSRFLLIFTSETRTPIITAPPRAIARYLEAHADECYPAKTEAMLTWKRKK